MNSATAFAFTELLNVYQTKCNVGQIYLTIATTARCYFHHGAGIVIVRCMYHATSLR